MTGRCYHTIPYCGERGPRMHILRMHWVPAWVPAWCGAVYHSHCCIPIRYVCGYGPCAWSARLLGVVRIT